MTDPSPTVPAVTLFGILAVVRRGYDRLMVLWAGQVCPECRGLKERRDPFCSAACEREQEDLRSGTAW